MGYPSDLSNEQWNIVEALLPPEKTIGRPREYQRRDLVNGIFYLMKTGCQQAYLPKDLPPWKSVYHFFNLLSENKVWEEINTALRKKVRLKEGRNENPSLASIDSQSVKGDVKLEAKGIDGNKKINGRKRHIVVDVLGFILVCMISSVNTADIKIGRELVSQLNQRDDHPRLEKLLADSSYKSLQENSDHIEVEITVNATPELRFIPIRHRQIIERTFAWLNRQRRLSKDYEIKTAHQKSMVFIGMIRLMLNRLA